MSRQFPALRGVAILLVVLNHSITLSLQAADRHGFPQTLSLERYLLVALSALGIIAVPTFLFLSGTFSAYAVRGKTLRESYRVVALGMRHIAIPYLIWSVVFYALIFFLQGDRFSLLEYGKNLLVGYPFSFVPILIFFYLISPFLVRISLRSPWLVLMAIGVYQLLTANVLRPGLLGFALPDWAFSLTLPALRVPMAIWGIFFPLGVVYGLHSKNWLPQLKRMKWLLILSAAATYSLAAMHELTLLRIPMAGLLCPVFVILAFPLIERNAIPGVEQLEQLGRSAYGLYLTNLIFISLALVFIEALARSLMGAMLLLVPIVITIAIAAPLILIKAIESSPRPIARRYVFG